MIGFKYFFVFNNLILFLSFLKLMILMNHIVQQDVTFILLGFFRAHLLFQLSCLFMPELFLIFTGIYIIYFPRMKNKYCLFMIKHFFNSTFIYNLIRTGIESLPQTRIFKSLFLLNQMT